MVAERCPQLLPQLLAEALKEGDQCCMVCFQYPAYVGDRRDNI